MIFLDSVEIKPTIFPDKTSQVWKLDPELLRPGFHSVTWVFENEAEIMHVAQLKTLLDANCCEARLEIPYVPYARQDKPISNMNTFALHTFAKLVNAMDFKWVAGFDPHSKACDHLIGGFHSELPSAEVSATVQKTGANMLFYPDQGALKKYGDTLRHQIIDLPRGYATKKRNQATGQIESMKIAGNVTDKKILIVDDICDGGATFIALADALWKEGAMEISLFVSHGLFTKGTEVLRQAGINRIFTRLGEV